MPGGGAFVASLVGRSEHSPCLAEESPARAQVERLEALPWCIVYCDVGTSHMEFADDKPRSPLTGRALGVIPFRDSSLTDCPAESAPIPSIAP